MSEPTRMGAGSDRASLCEHAESVLGEIKACSALVAPRSEDWMSTLQTLYVRTYLGEPDSDHPVVDIGMLDLYRRLFDCLGDFSVLTDPYLADSRARGLI